MMGRLAILLIRGYQSTLAAVLGGQCRFYPTCSAYCIQAIETHGAGRGLGLGLKRVAKCHPFHPGGVDLVPARNERPPLSAGRRRVREECA